MLVGTGMLLSDLKPNIRRVDEMTGGLAAVGQEAASQIKDTVGQAASAVGSKMKAAGQQVKATYQQGEIKALTQKYRTLRDQLLELIKKNARLFAEDIEIGEDKLLIELLGGLQALAGSALQGVRGAASNVASKVAGAGQQLVKNTQSTYVKGEAKQLLRQIGGILQQMKQMGVKMTPEEYKKLIRLKTIVLGQ